MFYVSSQIVANISEPSFLLYQKITIPIFRLILLSCAVPGYFPYILFYRYLFSLLSSGWIIIAVCGSISVREVFKQ